MLIPYVANSAGPELRFSSLPFFFDLVTHYAASKILALLLHIDSGCCRAIVSLVIDCFKLWQVLAPTSQALKDFLKGWAPGKGLSKEEIFKLPEFKKIMEAHIVPGSWMTGKPLPLSLVAMVNRIIGGHVCSAL